MSAAWIVFVKECRESLRDRRVLINALLLGPLLGPLLFVVLLRVTITRQLSQAAASAAGGGHRRAARAQPGRGARAAGS